MAAATATRERPEALFQPIRVGIAGALLFLSGLIGGFKAHVRRGEPGHTKRATGRLGKLGRTS
jgi:hypothetical protein